MSQSSIVHIDFVTEEYAEKLDRFADDHAVPREAAEQAFRTNCEELQMAFKDGTPGDVLRRIALHKLERDPPTEGTSRDSKRNITPSAIQD